MRTAALLLPLLLTGCANIQYAVDTYDHMPRQYFDHGGVEYPIHDRPDLSKLTIETPTSEALGTAVMQGLTFGAYPGSSAAALRPVVSAYLAPRGCQPVGAFLIMEPLWEFTYECEVSQQTAPAQWPTAPEPSESAPLEPIAGP